MVNVPLHFACGLYDRMQALYTGEVRPAGIDLRFEAIDDPRDIFDRMAGRQEFDLAEFSSSELITQKVAGVCPFVALPVFPSRVFRHGCITINRRSGIRAPADLAGKRIGVPLYTMSAAVWIRDLLQHEYGVDLSGVAWVQGAINQAGSHGSPTVQPLLRRVDITNNTGGRSLSELLAADELDAIIGTSLPDCMGTDPDVVRLFPDYRDLEKDYFRRTGIFPIMHLVVMRREIHEAHPAVAPSLFQAFSESKTIALQKMRWPGALRYMLPWLMADVDEIDDVFLGDPWPYGVEANRPTLEALMLYLEEQGLIAKALALDEIFVSVSP